jgi:hypothetical protein
MVSLIAPARQRRQQFQAAFSQPVTGQDLLRNFPTSDDHLDPTGSLAAAVERPQRLDLPDSQ